MSNDAIQNSSHTLKFVKNQNDCVHFQVIPLSKIMSICFKSISNIFIDFIFFGIHIHLVKTQKRVCLYEVDNISNYPLDMILLIIKVLFIDLFIFLYGSLLFIRIN